MESANYYPIEDLHTITRELRIKIPAEDTQSLQHVIELARENGCTIDSCTFLHKTLQHIRLESPPANYSDYNVEVVLKGESNHLKFVRYLLTKREILKLGFEKLIKTNAKEQIDEA